MVVVDNDDFKIDSLTGNATGAHRPNVLFVQQEKYKRNQRNLIHGIRRKNFLSNSVKCVQS